MLFACPVLCAMAAIEYFPVNKCGRSVELTTDFLTFETNIIPANSTVLCFCPAEESK
jgi:hypothetical protein